MDIPKYRFPVALIPGGCPQFLDFSFDLRAYDPKRLSFTRHFFEEKCEKKEDEYILRCLEEKEGGGWVDQSIGERRPAPQYGIKSKVAAFSAQATEELEPDPQHDSKPKESPFSLKCFEPFYEAWIPLPILRTKNPDSVNEFPVFEEGPSNWARCYIKRRAEDDPIVRLTMAFDTTLEEPMNENASRYYALCDRDVKNYSHYTLAWHVRDNSWFIQDDSPKKDEKPWAASWILDICRNWTTGQKEIRQTYDSPKDDKPHLKHLAYYLTFLELLNRLLNPRVTDDFKMNPLGINRMLRNDFQIYVVDPDRSPAIDVDLIVDIGNSRTTGVLFEQYPQRMTRISERVLLQIRDLSQPWQLYDKEPFATKIEFSMANFGNERYSRQSGRRTPAFPWGSAVRMGPEAVRLASRARNDKGDTGLSSPKRYLWDERPWEATWWYNTDTDSQQERATSGPFASQLNEAGTPVTLFKEEPPPGWAAPLMGQSQQLARQAKYTRSSLMMFLLGEVLMQALVTINSHGYRRDKDYSDIPRRLRRIVFTVPTGMPMAERRIYKRWMTLAVRTVWEAMRWEKWYWKSWDSSEKPLTDYRASPEPRCEWDEATCSQLVYLYNEITEKFHGDARHWFKVFGRERPEVYKNRPDIPPYHSVRVASIDIGGGTTDLSIMTYVLTSDKSAQPRILPIATFREGFSIAGDEIVKDIISSQIFDAFKKGFAAAGVRNPEVQVASLFRQDARTPADKRIRARFTQQVLVPMAHSLLALYEAYKASDSLSETPVQFHFHQFFESEAAPAVAGEQESHQEQSLFFRKSALPPEEILDYVKNAVGGTFSFMDVPIVFRPKDIGDSIQRAIGDVLDPLCEVIHAYGCDVLLLTGRPSRYFAAINEVVSRLPVPADRILPMCKYRVGTWYPFASSQNLIEDPKTTVVAGGMLCTLAESSLEGISFNLRDLAPLSSARYIGVMDTGSQIKADKVCFTVDVTRTGEYQKVVEMSGPLVIGFRQLPLERWPTTRFYVIEFNSDADRKDAENNGHFPLKLHLEFTFTGSDEPSREQVEGELKITEIEISAEGGGTLSPSKLSVRLQTLPLNEGYWLDTGIIR